MSEIKALVTSDSCPHCSDMKEYLKKKGLLDKVKIIRYETPEGKDFCEKNSITGVPECVVLTGANGEKSRVCSPQEFQKLLDEGQ
jgi:predicted thioredoxin/glutaredoxin